MKEKDIINLENEFMAWLLKKELAEKTRFSFPQFFSEIQTFCQETGVIHQSIFSIEKPLKISYIRMTIKDNIEFSKMYPRQHSNMKLAIDLYYKFLGERQKKIKQQTQASKIGVVDFESDNYLDSTTPITAVYYNQKMNNILQWKDVYIFYVTQLFKYHSHKLGNIYNICFALDDQKAFGKQIDKTNMLEPKEIVNGIFFDTCCSTNKIIHHLKCLFDLCKVDYEYIAITYRYDQKIKSAPVIPESTKTSKKPIHKRLSYERNTFIVDLRAVDVPHLEGSKPAYLRYYTVNYRNLDNWAELYTFLVKELMKDYPLVIRKYSGLSLMDDGKVDFECSENSLLMTSPKKVAPGLWLETDIPTIDIIQKISILLKACKINVQNIGIGYYAIKGIDDQDVQPKPVQSIPSPVVGATYDQIEETVSIGKTKPDAFLDWMVQEEKETVGTTIKYINKLKKVEKYLCITYGAEKKIYNTQNVEVIRDSIELLKSDVLYRLDHEDDFATIEMACQKYLKYVILYNWKNRREMQRMTKEVSQVLSKRDAPKVSDRDNRENCNVSRAMTPNVDLPISPQQSKTLTGNLTEYRTILLEHFKKGYRIDSIIDENRFRVFYKEKFGHDFLEPSLEHRKMIEKMTIVYKERGYLPEMMLDEAVKEELLSYIQRFFEKGSQFIFYQALYEKLQEFFARTQINNYKMLHAYLEALDTDLFYVNKSYIATSQEVEIDALHVIRPYLVELNKSITLEEAYRFFDYLPQKDIQKTFQSREFISNAKGKYFHESIIDFSEKEIEDIANIIQSGIDEKDYMSGNELISIIRKKYPDFAERYPELSDLGMRNIIVYKLARRFVFSGNVFSKFGKSLNAERVYARFAKEHERFTLDQLNEIKDDLNVAICFDVIYSNAIRKSKTEFISKDAIDFDVSAIDAAIARYLDNDYLPLQYITEFGLFPYIGIPWNTFILEYYVEKQSKDYKLMSNGHLSSTCAGVIASINAPYSDYEAVMSDALAHSTIELTNELALDYLVEQGYLARRQLKNIGLIINRAIDLRG